MKALFGLIIGLGLALLLTLLVNENPLHVATVLFKSAFGSREDLGATLYYTTSLIFTGLAVAIPFHAGLFNIGAEGQMVIGCLITSYLGLRLNEIPLPIPLLLKALIAVLIGALGSALYAAIPGYLKVYRKSHEVIMTMMMNFIAAGIASYVVLHIIKNPSSQNPESAPLAAGMMLNQIPFLSKMFPNSPANISFFIAVLCAVAAYIYLYETRMGFELRATGENDRASLFSGININRWKIFSMFLGGIFAGFVAFNEIIGSAGKFRLGFSPDYGFIGIAVALLARNNPLGIIGSAFIFGALMKGSSDLDLETDHITRDFSRVIQAIVILSVIVTTSVSFRKFQSTFQGILKWIKRD